MHLYNKNIQYNIIAHILIFSVILTESRNIMSVLYVIIVRKTLRCSKNDSEISTFNNFL